MDRDAGFIPIASFSFLTCGLATHEAYFLGQHIPTQRNIFAIVILIFNLVVHDLRCCGGQEVDGERVAQRHREVTQHLFLTSPNCVEKSLKLNGLILITT